MEDGDLCERCGEPLTEDCNVAVADLGGDRLTSAYQLCAHGDDVHLPGGGCSECSPDVDWEHDYWARWWCANGHVTVEDLGAEVVQG